MSTTELELGIRIILRITVGTVSIDTSPAETRLETVVPDNGKDKPEKTNEKPHMSQHGGGLFETLKNDLLL